MAGTKFAVMMMWVSLISSCKTSEASSQSKSVAPSEVYKNSPQGQVKKSDIEKPAPAPKPQVKNNQVLLQWVYGRYPLDTSADQSADVKHNPGTVNCSVTKEAFTREADAGKLDKLQDALKMLRSYKDSTKRNVFFRAVEPSRELIAFTDSGEFVIEWNYDAQVVLTPPTTDLEVEFNKALELVMNVANDPKLCTPKK